MERCSTSQEPLGIGTGARLLPVLLCMTACTHVEDLGTGAPSPNAAHSQTAKADGFWEVGRNQEPDHQTLDAPVLDEEPAPICPAAAEQSWYFQFLDNLCGDKVLPTSQDRDRSCPVGDTSPVMTLATGEQVVYQPASDAIQWDTTSLQGLAPGDMHLVVILVKRVDGVPHYRYLSTGSHYEPFQPWSTSKFLAVANAAVELRLSSEYQVGLSASVDGHPLGDLVTSLVAYDNNPFSSNSLGAYFHDIGGRANANAMINWWWLKRPDAESFGGNYGDLPPALGSTFVEHEGATVTIEPKIAGGHSNRLSAYTLAESLKRLALHREEPSQQLPGIQWEDVKVLLYGAEGSHKGRWGGMSSDTAAYLHAAHDMAYIEKRSQGQWTVFSKLGLGTSAEFAHVGYGCWPVLDSAGVVVDGQGREFVIAAHMPEGPGAWVERDRELARVYRRIALRIVDGRI